MSDGVAARPGIRAKGRSSSIGDALFAALTRTAGVFVLVLLGAIIVVLFIGGWPAFRAFGPAFLTSTAWNPVTHRFGAVVAVYGTIVTSLLAGAWLEREVRGGVPLRAARPAALGSRA